MTLEDLVKNTIHEGQPAETPPKNKARIEELEDAIIELASIIEGGNASG